MLFHDEIKKICDMIDENKPCLKEQKAIIMKFKQKWKDIMVETGLYNKMCQTFSPNKISLTNYGLKTSIYIVPPLYFEKLNNVIEVLQENFGCMILLNHNKTSPFINAKFIFNPKDSVGFKVVKQKYPWEIYIGNDYSGEPIIVDASKYVHVLESGGTRSGKSVQQSIILTNLIANIPPEEVNLYLCQVAKSDLILFKNCLHTKAYASTLLQIHQVLNYIVNTEMPRRAKLIEPYRECAKANNFKDYNKLSHTEKMIPSFVVFDETSSLFQKTSGDLEGIKDDIIFFIEEIARYGASLGFCLITSLQRPTRDNLSPLVKSQSTTNISFRQNNSKSSEVALDDPKVALGLEQREFVYRLASKEVEYGIVPWVTDLELQEVIKKYKKPHRTLFDDLEKLRHRNGIKHERKSLQEIGTHIETEEEILEKNIAKIKDFVPYDSGSNTQLIDKTKLPTKTMKPTKTRKVVK